MNILITCPPIILKGTTLLPLTQLPVLAMGSPVKWNSWPGLLITLLIACFWGTWVQLYWLLTVWRKGPRRFFHYEERMRRPAIMEDPSLGAHGLVTLAKGLKLHTVTRGPEGAPLMLFLHGFPECWFSWRHQMRAFSGDYRCVAVDMRGYGESDKPSAVAAYHMQELVDDVRELVAALGYKTCVLVAHDWGGVVAARLAQHEYAPALLNALILMNAPHPNAFRLYIEESKSQMLKSWYIFFFQLPLLPELQLRQDDFNALNFFSKKRDGALCAPCTADEVEVFRYSLSQPGGLTGPINYYRAAQRYLPECEAPSQGGILVPTLVIFGEQDDFLEKGLIEKGAQYFNDLKTVMVPTSGHWVNQEEPEVVNQAMRDFLTRN